MERPIDPHRGGPVLAAGDTDPHVPWWRVEETAEALRRQGAQVDLHRFPDLGHTIHPTSLAATRSLVESLLSKP